MRKNGVLSLRGILNSVGLALGVGAMFWALSMEAQAGTYTVSGGPVTVTATSGGQTVTQGGSTTTDATPVITSTYNSGTAITIHADAGCTAYVILQEVSCDVSQQGMPALETNGAGNVILELNGNSTLSGGHSHAGLQKENTGTLTIADEEGTTAGSLTATGGIGGAGIGGREQGNGSNITIAGGFVTATGGVDGAGIGGGEQGNGSNITITGGTVTATGGIAAAGIGGGIEGNGSNITITGGTVIASGGDFGAGIGSGIGTSSPHTQGSNIQISGGEVIAVGGPSAAGIGGGNWGDGSQIAISGSAHVSVAGGGLYTDPYGHYYRGAGTAIGNGSLSQESTAEATVPGTAVTPDTSNLYTTGWIDYYSVGTSVNAIRSGSVSATRVAGSADPSSTGSGSDPSSAGAGPSATGNGTGTVQKPVNWLLKVENKIKDAIKADGKQTIEIKGYPTLSYTIMKLLEEHPDLTLISSYSYKGEDYQVTIPGDKVETDENIPWYGPLYLYGKYGQYGTQGN